MIRRIKVLWNALKYEMKLPVTFYHAGIIHYIKVEYHCLKYGHPKSILAAPDKIYYACYKCNKR